MYVCITLGCVLCTMQILMCVYLNDILTSFKVNVCLTVCTYIYICVCMYVYDLPCCLRHRCTARIVVRGSRRFAGLAGSSPPPRMSGGRALSMGTGSARPALLYLPGANSSPESMYVCMYVRMHLNM